MATYSQYSCLEKPTDRGAWWAPWGPKESARLSAEIFPSNYTSRHAMLLSPHHWNTFHVFPCNLYCLFVHPTADNTVLSTTEKSPTADLLRLYACPHLEKQATASDQATVAPFTAAYADSSWLKMTESLKLYFKGF